MAPVAGLTLRAPVGRLGRAGPSPRTPQSHVSVWTKVAE